MKKFIACFTAAALILSLGGCGQQTAEISAEQVQSTQTDENTAEETTADAAEESNTTGEEDTAQTNSGSHVPVAYFSATGNTEAVAGYIADNLGADVFEITPAQPYSMEDLSRTDENSRVSREHDDESLRDVELVSTTVENREDYDTVFIGYPIWWGIAAWPVDSFVAANDFTGKTVIPFCTSSSSDMGESGELLAETTGTGDWLEGERFRSAVDESDVADRLEGLDLSQ